MEAEGLVRLYRPWCNATTLFWERVNASPSS
jgi:hypothetical protein